MKLIRKTKKGFTLVELIVVIAIVAILAAVSVVSYIAFINQANLSADQQMVYPNEQNCSSRQNFK